MVSDKEWKWEIGGERVLELVEVSAFQALASKNAMVIRHCMLPHLVSRVCGLVGAMLQNLTLAKWDMVMWVHLAWLEQTMRVLVLWGQLVIKVSQAILVGAAIVGY